MSAKPKYKVGDWVELNCYGNHQGQIKEMFDESYEQIGIQLYKYPTFKITGLSGHFSFSCITRKLKPSEVILDFGNGIKGTITRCVTYSGNGIENPSIKVSNNGIGIANILLHTITEPMRTTVLELLKAQEEECGN